MATSIKGTRTEKNLLAAFAGAARKEGLMQIADIFEETAAQEKEHAKRFFSFLEGGEVEIIAGFPAGTVGTTLDNLKAAAAGEEHEWTSLYPGFANVAREEGYRDVALARRSQSGVGRPDEPTDDTCITSAPGLINKHSPHK